MTIYLFQKNCEVLPYLKSRPKFRLSRSNVISYIWIRLTPSVGLLQPAGKVRPGLGSKS